MTTIEDFSTKELRVDLETSQADVEICKSALSLGVAVYGSGKAGVQVRLDINRAIVATIGKELKRREALTEVAFANAMRLLKSRYDRASYDSETVHVAADKLCWELLRNLGYDEAMDILESIKPFWYAS